MEVQSMTRAEKKAIREWASKLSDEELETEYYKAVFATLGSEAEEMCERGFDIRDCVEREKYERDLLVRSHLIEQLCVERGIPLWEESADHE
jgi:hypothetical protein